MKTIDGRDVTLRSAWKGWIVLEGGANWASIEGDPEEWRSVADGLDRGESVRHKRLACVITGGEAAFSSPRNAHSDRDVVRLNASQWDAFLAAIGAAIEADAAMPEGT